MSSCCARQLCVRAIMARRATNGGGRAGVLALVALLSLVQDSHGTSCVGHCGKRAGYSLCYCDFLCSFYEDCCDDFAAACPATTTTFVSTYGSSAPVTHLVPSPGTSVLPPAAGGGGGVIVPAPDGSGSVAPGPILFPAPINLNQTYPSPSPGLVPAPTTTEFVNIYSCEGLCGSLTPTASSCYCHSSCLTYNDCCNDYELQCAGFVEPPRTCGAVSTACCRGHARPVDLGGDVSLPQTLPGPALARSHSLTCSSVPLID